MGKPQGGKRKEITSHSFQVRTGGQKRPQSTRRNGVDWKRGDIPHNKKNRKGHCKPKRKKRKEAKRRLKTKRSNKRGVIVTGLGQKPKPTRQNQTETLGGNHVCVEKKKKAGAVKKQGQKRGIPPKKKNALT